MSGFNIVRMTVFLPSYVSVREQLPLQFTSNNVNRCKESRALSGKSTLLLPMMRLGVEDLYISSSALML